MEELYHIVNKFVTESFINSGIEFIIRHLVRTVYWVRQLKPNADEALLIAALAHDIERAYRDVDVNEDLATYNEDLETDAYLSYHQRKSAEITAEFLDSHNADKDVINRVKMLISRHEVGGNEDQNILKDADSLSFLELIAEINLNQKTSGVNKAELRVKTNLMFKRITSVEAKEIARKFYESAIGNLSAGAPPEFSEAG